MSRKAPENPAQIKVFREAARELEADESEDVFDSALKKIAKHKPKERDEKR
jgi:hypothetical protein